MRGVVAAGVTPDHMAVVATLGSLAVGAAIALNTSFRWLLLLPLWLLARLALDAMAGMAAHEHGRTSRTGGVLHEVGSIVSDLALHLPLALVDPRARWAVVAFVIAAALTEFCGVLGPTLGGSRRHDGPMGRGVRALLVGVLGLLGAFWPRSLAGWPAVFWIATALAALTCWNRVRRSC